MSAAQGEAAGFGRGPNPRIDREWAAAIGKLLRIDIRLERT